ncbi:HlyD family efflux transporter periplasmic adaptor subunit [Eubacteriales bacterium OttesenSCG-928-K08]|nr:HlyD family efflux transporter periplasmic adaptor subunit [Eubacteriales bacterium OttesenSCG-928-K08]
MDQDINTMPLEQTDAQVVADPKKVKPKKGAKREKTQPGQKKKRKKIKARWIVLGVIVIVIAVVFITCRNAAQNVLGNLLAFDDTTVLAYGNLEYSVGATGTVITAQGRNVHSSQTYNVEEIHVERGDYVNEGDPLCTLDSKSLRDQIEKKELSINISAKSAAQQVKSARDSYNASKDALDSGLNSTLNSAQNTVQDAKEKLETAQQNYADFKAGKRVSLIAQAEATLRSAQTALDNAKATYNSLANAVLAPGDTKPDDYDHKLTTARRALDAALETYNDAYDALKAAKDSTEEDYEKAVENAQTAYDRAKTSLTATEASINQQLQSNLNSYKTAQLGANNELALYELAALQESLEDTVIRAPISGTVTAVYAKEGESGSGLLFVIEDTKNLLVDTTVKEYDMNLVTEGMPVTIKSDATGDDVYEGEITHIAPTSSKSSTSSSDVVFPTEVTILSKDNRLRIGMSVRLNYIIEHRENVLKVPYDAVYTNAQGQKCVLIITPQADGNYLIGELPVETGMENDLDVEIYGEGVVEGLRIINAPTDYRMLIGQSIPVTEHRVYSGGTGMMMFGVG